MLLLVVVAIAVMPVVAPVTWVVISEIIPSHSWRSECRGGHLTMDCSFILTYTFHYEPGVGPAGTSGSMPAFAWPAFCLFAGAFRKQGQTLEEIEESLAR